MCVRAHIVLFIDICNHWNIFFYLYILLHSVFVYIPVVPVPHWWWSWQSDSISCCWWRYGSSSSWVAHPLRHIQSHNALQSSDTVYLYRCPGHLFGQIVARLMNPYWLTRRHPHICRHSRKAPAKSKCNHIQGAVIFRPIAQFHWFCVTFQ